MKGDKLTWQLTCTDESGATSEAMTLKVPGTSPHTKVVSYQVPSPIMVKPSIVGFTPPAWFDHMVVTNHVASSSTIMADGYLRCSAFQIIYDLNIGEDHTKFWVFCVNPREVRVTKDFARGALVMWLAIDSVAKLKKAHNPDNHHVVLQAKESGVQFVIDALAKAPFKHCNLYRQCHNYPFPVDDE